MEVTNNIIEEQRLSVQPKVGCIKVPVKILLNNQLLITNYSMSSSLLTPITVSEPHSDEQRSSVLSLTKVNPIIQNKSLLSAFSVVYFYPIRYDLRRLGISRKWPSWFCS